MSPNVVLAATAAALIAAGVYLILERSLTRVLLGILLTGNGVNILFLVASGPAKGAPIVGVNKPEDMSDPLPQAMVLTAIVITLGMAAFLLAMAYRSWQLNGNDDVQDDTEDATIRRLAKSDTTSQTYDDDTIDDDASDNGAEDADEEGVRR